MNNNLVDYMRSQILTFFKNQPCFDSIEARVNYHVMIAVTRLILAAKIGVDSCPMKWFVTAQVKSAFNIPESVDCYLLPLGYTTDPIKPYGARFDLDQCYQETYGKAFQL